MDPEKEESKLHKESLMNDIYANISDEDEEEKEAPPGNPF